MKTTPEIAWRVWETAGRLMGIWRNALACLSECDKYRDSCLSLTERFDSQQTVYLSENHHAECTEPLYAPAMIRDDIEVNFYRIPTFLLRNTRYASTTVSDS